MAAVVELNTSYPEASKGRQYRAQLLHVAGEFVREDHHALGLTLVVASQQHPAEIEVIEGTERDALASIRSKSRGPIASGGGVSRRY